MDYIDNVRLVMRNLNFLTLSLLALLILSACKETILVNSEQVKQVPRHQEEITLSYGPVVKQVAPAVVNIFAIQHVKLNVPSTPFMVDPFFKQLFENYHHGKTYSKEQNSLGSGVIISSEGLILTNY